MVCTFHETGQLGLVFNQSTLPDGSQSLAVDQILDNTQAKQFTRLQRGLLIASVNGRDVQGMPWADTINLMKSRPATIVFEPPPVFDPEAPPSELPAVGTGSEAPPLGTPRSLGSLSRSLRDNIPTTASELAHLGTPLDGEDGVPSTRAPPPTCSLIRIQYKSVSVQLTHPHRCCQILCLPAVACSLPSDMRGVLARPDTLLDRVDRMLRDAQLRAGWPDPM